MKWIMRTMIMCFIIFSCAVESCFAQGNLEIVNIPPNFPMENIIELVDTSGLMYKTQPVFANNLYLQLDYLSAGMPDHYKWDGFSNSPMYVYDESFNLIKTIEYDDFMCGLYFKKGYYYFIKVVYKDGKGKYTYYKATGNEDVTEISSDEFSRAINVQKMSDNLEYTCMEYTMIGDTCYTGERTEYLIDSSNVLREIKRENKKAVHSQYSTVCGDIGIVTWWRRDAENPKLNHRYIALDGVTPFEVPIDTDIQSLGKDDMYLYIGIQDNEEHCYRVPLSALLRQIKIAFNNTYLSFEEPPVVEEGRTLVPMRFLFEQMGDSVAWDEETQTVTASNESNAVTFSINSRTAKVNNAPVTMDVPAQLIGDKTYVPLRFLSENLGYTVTWDEETKTASIITE